MSHSPRSTPSTPPPPTPGAALPRAVGWRCIALVSLAVERLRLLDALAVPSTAGTGDQPGAAGWEGPGGVADLLAAARALERRYGELLSLLAKPHASAFDSQLDPAFYTTPSSPTTRGHQRELEEVASQLSSLSRQLMRRLRGDPDDWRNRKKVADLRTELAAALADCAAEMTATASASGPSQRSPKPGMNVEVTSPRASPAPSPHAAMAARGVVTYDRLAQRVGEDAAERSWAAAVLRRRPAEAAAAAARARQGEAPGERLARQRELEARRTTLQDLKAALRRATLETREQHDRSRAEGEARVAAMGREARGRQADLRERVEHLRKELEVEHEVFSHLEQHLTKKASEVQGRTAEWTQRQDEDLRRLEGALATGRRRREDQAERLSYVEERLAVEVERQRARDDLERRLAQDQKMRTDLRKSEHAAASKLQAAVKALLVRRQMEEARKRKRRPKAKPTAKGRAKAKAEAPPTTADPPAAPPRDKLP